MSRTKHDVDELIESMRQDAAFLPSDSPQLRGYTVKVDVFCCLAFFLTDGPDGVATPHALRRTLGPKACLGEQRIVYSLAHLRKDGWVENLGFSVSRTNGGSSYGITEHGFSELVRQAPPFTGFIGEQVDERQTAFRSVREKLHSSIPEEARDIIACRATEVLLFSAHAATYDALAGRYGGRNAVSPAQKAKHAATLARRAEEQKIVMASRKAIPQAIKASITAERRTRAEEEKSKKRLIEPNHKKLFAPGEPQPSVCNLCGGFGPEGHEDLCDHAPVDHPRMPDFTWGWARKRMAEMAPPELLAKAMEETYDLPMEVISRWFLLVGAVK